MTLNKKQIGHTQFNNKHIIVGGYYNGVKYDLDQTVPGGCSLDLN